jgi:hypothetical protein
MPKSTELRQQLHDGESEMGSKEARIAIEDLTFVNALTRLASLGRQVTFHGLRLTGKA